jgi:hypothetical protein
VTRSGAFAANGTDRSLLDIDNEPESIGVAFDAIQNQQIRAWKKIANGSGETLEHPALFALPACLEVL